MKGIIKINLDDLVNISMASCPVGFALSGLGLKSCHGNQQQGRDGRYGLDGNQVQLAFGFKCTKILFDSGRSEIISGDCASDSNSISSSSSESLYSLLSSTKKVSCPLKSQLMTSFKFIKCRSSSLAFQLTCTQFDRNECDSSPCMNGGTCIDEITKHSCICPPTFSGTTCADHRIHEADPMHLVLNMATSSTGSGGGFNIQPWILYFIIGGALIMVALVFIGWLYSRRRGEEALQRSNSEYVDPSRPPIESEHLLIRDYEQKDPSDL